MGARVFVWIGGALFVASLSLCAWSYAFVLGRSTPFGGWQPIAVDVALITMFALHHSLCARAAGGGDDGQQGAGTRTSEERSRASAGGLWPRCTWLQTAPAR